MIVRNCTICMWRDRREPAAYVATARDGLQWFECGGHEAREHGELLGDDSSDRTLEPLGAWLARNRLPLFEPGTVLALCADFTHHTRGTAVEVTQTGVRCDVGAGELLWFGWHEILAPVVTR
ncbi:MAG TPA: hypothetical protein VF420_13325 [Casimicrobiaceae bacterium]